MLKVLNPASGLVINELPTDTPGSIRQKWQSAKLAQLNWASRSLEERIGVIRKFRQYLISHKERLAHLLTQEVGKPISQSLNEINGTLSRLDYFTEASQRLMGIATVWQDAPNRMKEQISREPLGVIANISAWNYPYFVGSNVFIPALITGNAVLYKPSELASLTGLAIAEGLYESGVPKDVFATILGDGSVGSELLQLKLDGVFFTGSQATGRKIAEVASKQLTKVQLELGGKDPAYVSEHSDVKAAAESLADGAFYNCGQSCCSVERIYVHEKIYDDFLIHFKNTVESFKMGDPNLPETYLGPLARVEQIGVLQNQIRDAVSKGAQIIYGGKKIAELAGNFFEPTVLVHVNHSMLVMKDESFGPVIGIQKVSNDNEALQLMNDTEYGLTAAVYTTKEDQAMAFMSALNTGTVYWNCCDRVSPRLPWAGRKNSGLGLTLGDEGILTFTNTKAWHLKSPSN